MTIVRVFGQTYINPANVGKVTFEMSMPGEVRKNVTTLFDLHSGIICSLETTVVIPSYSGDQDPIKKDNFLHEKIIAAIRDGRDAGAHQ